jgi:rhodanese-related sulfurtransferase
VVQDFNVLDQVLEQMDLEFIGQGKHKISTEKLFSVPNALLLDIRTSEEGAALPLAFPGQVESVHIPLSELPTRWAEIDQEAEVGIFCPHGVRASIAYTYLRARGYTKVRVLDGGYPGITEMARPGVVWASVSRPGK